MSSEAPDAGAPDAPPPDALPPDGLAPDAELAATFAAPRRLHVAAAVTNAVLALRGLAFPILAAVFVGGSGGGLGRAVLYGVLGAGFSLVTGIVTWRATSYQLVNRTLRFRAGVLSPDETVIPLARVQAIDTVQGPVQRLFGAVELHVQTPGGGERGEIVLSAVAPRDARALRAAVGLAEPAQPGVRHRLGAGALVVAALTAPQFGVVLPLIGAAFAGAGDLFGNDVGEGIADRLDSGGELLMAAVVLLAASLLVSFLAAIVAFAGFEVERDHDRLRIRRGLLQRRVATIPVARIDGVTIVEGLARAPFGLATVRLETSGYRREAAAARTLLPLVRVRDVPALLAELVPGLASTGSDPSEQVEGPSAPGRVDGSLHAHPPGRSVRRYVLPQALAGVAAGGAIGGGAALAGAAAIAWAALPVLALLGAGNGVLAHRAAGLRLEPDRVVLRARRGTARITVLARRRRLQEAHAARNPFQRRAGLATFGLALGSGRRASVRHLEAAAADAALAALES